MEDSEETSTMSDGKDGQCCSCFVIFIKVSNKYIYIYSILTCFTCIRPVHECTLTFPYLYMFSVGVTRLWDNGRG